MTAVTVVMPVLNEERSVTDAIRSVLAQTFDDIELLVVDGDSTDATVPRVLEIAATEKRVRLLRNPARTIPHALNVALAQASGRFLARVDGHAGVSETYLERAVRTLAADPQIAAVGGRRIGVARTRAGVAVATALSSRFGVGDSINHYADTAQDTDHASFGVFRTDVLRAVNGWDEGLLVNEDVDIDHRIRSQGHRIWFDPEMHIYWHVRESVPALARQYRRYGRGKAAMVRKNGLRAVRPRHLAPPLLVLALVLALLLDVLGLWPLAVLLAAPYLVALTLATALTLRAAGPVMPPPAPAPGAPAARSDAVRSGEPVGARPGPLRLAAAFVAMHTGWGLGFLEGLVLRLAPAPASAKLPRSTRPPASFVTGAAEIVELDIARTADQQAKGTRRR